MVIEDILFSAGAGCSQPVARVTVSNIYHRCMFQNFASATNGGAFSISAGSPLFDSCSFVSNTAISNSVGSGESLPFYFWL